MKKYKWIFISASIFVAIVIPLIIYIFFNSQGNGTQTDVNGKPTPDINSQQSYDQSSSPNSVSQNTSQSTKVVPVTDNTKVNTVDDKLVWLIFTHSYYTISYLSNWNHNLTSNSSGGTTVTFNLNFLNKYDSIPNLTIAETPVNPKFPLSDKIKIYSQMGLTQSIKTFQGIKATVLTGTMQNEDNSTPNQNKIYKTYIFLTKTYRDYVISFTYFEDTNAQKYQQIFDTMLNSFVFLL